MKWIFHLKYKGKEVLQIIVMFYVSMALQPFVGPWPLLEFLDFLHSRLDSLDGGSARRKAATYTQNNTNTK
jgi:hypothetical protein